MHSEYVILIALPRQQWLRQRSSMLHSAYIDCLVPAKLLSALFFSTCMLQANGCWPGQEILRLVAETEGYIAFQYTPPYVAVEFSRRPHVRF